MQDVLTFFDTATGSWSYLVVDPHRRQAVVIDPVLDYDAPRRERHAPASIACCRWCASGIWTWSGYWRPTPMPTT